MNMAIKSAFIFIAGAAIGAVATWKITKAKYEKIAQEEIDSVKEVYSTNKEESTEAKAEEIASDTDSDEDADPVEEEYHEIASTYASKSTKEEPELAVKPYIIHPDELGAEDGYDVQTLDYYADGVLADNWGIQIKDIEGTVGKESLNHFGEYEEDTICVRNDNTMTDYEICRDTQKYSDAMKQYDDYDEYNG